MSRSAERLPRGFWFLVAGQATSLAGNGLQQIAVPLWIYQRTGSALSAGAAFAVQFIPMVVFAPWAGHLVDRFDRRRILIGCEVLSGLAVVALFLAVVEGALPVVYLMLAVLRLFNALTMPALQAASMQLVPESAHRRSATVIETLLGGINTLAPLGGTALAALLGIEWVLLANLVSFAVAALLLLPVPVCPGSPELRGALGSTLSALVRNGRNGLLRWTALAEAAYFLLFGADTAVLLILAEQRLGAEWAGICATAAGAGWLLASVLLIPRCKHRPVALVTVSALACPVAVLLVVAGAHVGAVALFPAAMALGVVNIGVAAGATVIYQEQVVKGTEGRVFAIRRALLNAMLTLSYLILPGVAGTWLGITGALLVFAVATAVVVCLAALVAVRRETPVAEVSAT
ncbi:MFS transporter [Nonomuraea sp. NN258]|uniref:MFS transporter n=1 Tax=Nonomuraea antri TaxID=2730852 RepID=UPI00156A35B1|nr:MFS transporter [Nonomuraea antri]NRQ37370.1 MFS transporter [Nonomuraea antri]